MSTANDLIQEARRYLYSGTLEAKNRLTAGVVANDVSLTFDFELAGIKEGAQIAIDLELFHVWAVNENSRTATVVGAQLGSTAAAHSAGSVVTVAPKFSDFALLQAINADIADLSSPANGLFQMETVTVTYQSAISGYDLTGVTELLDVYEVRYDETGPEKEWPRIQSWELRRDSDTTDFPSGLQLLLLEAGQSGRDVRVQYKAPYGSLAALTDDVQTVTGLSTYADDIPPLGAAMRLGIVREVQRNFNDSQGETRRAEEVPPGAIQGSVRGLMGMREQRIQHEARRLAQQYPRRMR